MKHPVKAILGLLLAAAMTAGCSPATSPTANTPSPSPSPSPQNSVPAATPTPTASAVPATPTPKPTAAPPAAPTGVAWTSLADPATCPAKLGPTCFKYKVDWSEADPTGVTIDIIGVTKCLDKPHCVLPTTTIPPSQMVLLASASASKKSTTVILGGGQSNGAGWLPGSGGKTLYIYGVVVQARSPAGKSGLVVAWAW